MENYNSQGSLNVPISQLINATFTQMKECKTDRKEMARLVSECKDLVACVQYEPMKKEYLKSIKQYIKDRDL